jgi:hypothetical protein
MRLDQKVQEEWRWRRFEFEMRTRGEFFKSTNFYAALQVLTASEKD